MITPFPPRDRAGPNQAYASFGTGAWTAQAGRPVRRPQCARDAGEGAREESRHRLAEPSNYLTPLYHDPGADARVFWRIPGAAPTSTQGRRISRVPWSSDGFTSSASASSCQPVAGNASAPTRPRRPWLSGICLLAVRTVGGVCGKLDAGPVEEPRRSVAGRVNGSLTPL